MSKIISIIKGRLKKQPFFSTSDGNPLSRPTDRAREIPLQIYNFFPCKFGPPQRESKGNAVPCWKLDQIYRKNY